MIETIICGKGDNFIRILITGCSSGFGLVTAQRLLQLGHEPIGVSRRPWPLGAPSFHWCQADLTALDGGLEWLVENVAVERLVHAAGFQHTAHLGELDPKRAMAMWRLHVDAPSRLLDTLVEQHHPLARVILIGSRTQQGGEGEKCLLGAESGAPGFGSILGDGIDGAGCHGQSDCPGGNRGNGRFSAIR